MKSPFGRHILAEYFECGCTYLDSEAAIRDLMLEAASRTGATIVGSIFWIHGPALNISRKSCNRRSG